MKGHEHEQGRHQISLDLTVDTPGAARYVGLRPQTMRVLRMSGAGPAYIRIGGPMGRVRYRVSALDEWMRARTFTSTAQEAAKLAKEEAVAKKGEVA